MSQTLAKIAKFIKFYDDLPKINKRHDISIDVQSRLLWFFTLLYQVPPCSVQLTAGHRSIASERLLTVPFVSFSWHWHRPSSKLFRTSPELVTYFQHSATVGPVGIKNLSPTGLLCLFVLICLCQRSWRQKNIETAFGLKETKKNHCDLVQPKKANCAFNHDGCDQIHQGNGQNQLNSHKVKEQMNPQREKRISDEIDMDLFFRMLQLITVSKHETLKFF